MAGLNRAAVRRVALEVRRVDLDSHDPAGPPEGKEGPLVARLPAPMRLPALSHVRTQAGKSDVERRAVMLVAAGHEPAAMGHGQKIERRAAVLGGKVTLHLAVDAKAGDAAIRVDIEADMRPGAIVLDWK